MLGRALAVSPQHLVSMTLQQLVPTKYPPPPPPAPAEGSNVLLKLHRLRQDLYEHLATVSGSRPYRPPEGQDLAMDFELFHTSFWPQVGRPGLGGWVGPGGRGAGLFIFKRAWAGHVTSKG